jgi:2,4-dienoyl-CoA reductase-like NADH-dependent reductase (Old Yellow Enzyme family)
MRSNLPKEEYVTHTALAAAAVLHPLAPAHPEMRGGELPVAPSPIPAAGDFFLPSGRVDFPIPRQLRIEEIAPIVESFAQATRNARKAGFDGVPFLANPDLPERLRRDLPLNKPDAASFYGVGAKDYTDYPAVPL